MSRHIRVFAIGFLLLQGVGGLIWWVALAAWPEARTPFLAKDAPDSTLLAFVGADLLLYVGGSFASAWGLWARSPWGWPVLCIHTGATAYAGLYTLVLCCFSPSSWLAGVMMAPSVVVTPWLAWEFRPQRGFDGDAQNVP